MKSVFASLRNICSILLVLSPCLDLRPHHRRPRRDAMSKNLVDYLTQFGYLPHSESEALLSEQQLRDAVRNLQFYAHLNTTGEIDSDTLAVLAKPRCGVPDVSHPGYRNRRYNLQGQRWSKTNLTWSLRNGPSRSVIALDVIRRELSLALDMWSRETRLTFQEVEAIDEEADLQVFFHRHFHGDGYPFDGSGSVLAHAFFPGSGRGGDIHFDDDEAWSEKRVINREITSVFAVAVHEFGHSLGLSHSSVEGSLMFPWYSGVPDDYRLPRDDLEAIRHLYGQPTFGLLPEGDPSDNEIPDGATETNGDVDVDDDDRTGLPDKCETNFDAVAVIRSEMWVFKGRYFWRIDRNGGTREDPIELSSFWYGLPQEIERVDAVYERPDHKIIFFVGRHYYILTGNSQLEAGPIPITRLGLPTSTEKVDGAMRWGWNGKTYFFSDTMYWRFDEDIQHVELDYPRDINVWGGVPYNIDAVFQFTDRKTYFFKGRNFWLFDDVRMRVAESDPTPISQYWMHCPKEIKDPFKSSIGMAGSSPARNFLAPAVLFVTVRLQLLGIF